MNTKNTKNTKKKKSLILPVLVVIIIFIFIFTPILIGVRVMLCRNSGNIKGNDVNVQANRANMHNDVNTNSDLSLNTNNYIGTNISTNSNINKYTNSIYSKTSYLFDISDGRIYRHRSIINGYNIDTNALLASNDSIDGWQTGRIPEAANQETQNSHNALKNDGKDTGITEESETAAVYQADNHHYSISKGSLEEGVDFGWNMDKSGGFFYMGEDGEVLKGEQKINGETYLFSESGIMRTGFAYSNGILYYYSGDGKRQSGWIKANGNWYYSTDDAGIWKNRWVDGTYFVGNDGKMLCGERLGFIYFDRYGRRTDRQGMIRDYYAKLLDKMEDTYGKAYLDEETNRYKGVCFYKLVDFDIDGYDEILIVHEDVGKYITEIYKVERFHISRIFSEDWLYGLESEKQSVVLGEYNGIPCIMVGSSINYFNVYFYTMVDGAIKQMLSIEYEPNMDFALINGKQGALSTAYETQMRWTENNVYYGLTHVGDWTGEFGERGILAVDTETDVLLGRNIR